MIVSDKIKERRRLGNVKSSAYRREKSKPRLETNSEEHRKWECKRSTTMRKLVIYISYGWRRGMLKVKVVVATRMAASRSQGCAKQCGQ